MQIKNVAKVNFDGTFEWKQNVMIFMYFSKCDAGIVDLLRYIEIKGNSAPKEVI